jgi:hypothetical protein
MCHQRNGHLCSGWVGCHDIGDNMAIRFAAMHGHISPNDVDAVLDYVCPVPLFASGAEAAAHGMAGVDEPAEDAQDAIGKLTTLRSKRGA